jgi:DNA-binding CsgD family transcriptional regulator
MNQLPTRDEIVRLSRLLHELCEIGADTHAWRERLMIEIESCIDAQFSASYLMRFSLDPNDFLPKTLIYIERGMNDHWRRYVAAGDLSRDPVTPHIMKRFGTDFTVMRSEFVDDQTYFASDYHSEIAVPAGLGDIIYSQVAVKDPSVVDGLGFSRKTDKPRFTAHEVAIVRFVHQELARLWNRPDAVGTHALPTRQREVLDGIRRGETRKVIADKMGVSEHTIHGYEKSLFERAGVKSRGELLASLAGVIRPNLLP